MCCKCLNIPNHAWWDYTRWNKFHKKGMLSFNWNRNCSYKVNLVHATQKENFAVEKKKLFWIEDWNQDQHRFEAVALLGDLAKSRIVSWSLLEVRLLLRGLASLGYGCIGVHGWQHSSHSARHAVLTQCMGHCCPWVLVPPISRSHRISQKLSPKVYRTRAPL